METGNGWVLNRGTIPRVKDCGILENSERKLLHFVFSLLVFFFFSVKFPNIEKIRNPENLYQ
jgi:hypothetical protein